MDVDVAIGGFTKDGGGNKNKIPFLDILIIRNNNTLSTAVFRKPTNSDIYIHWKAFAPETWKRGTLRTLTRRAHIVCSSHTLIQQELQHLRRSFTNINGYPHHVITQIFESVKHSFNTPPTPPLHIPTQSNPPPNIPPANTLPIANNNITPSMNLLILPYNGKTGELILKDMKRTIKTILPPTIDTKICFTSTKLSSKFNFTDKTESETLT